MAYTKRTWLGRQGTGLNKFSIGGASPVTIVNQPDSVTQVGDALSAGNLNDLEDRIEDAFDDVDTALDTKADEQDVTNLNNALTAIDHRVQNLEQAKGKYVVSNYKDGSITPSGKGNWAVVEGLRGVSRVENNQVQNPSFGTGVLSPWTIVGGNATVNDNKVVVTSASLCALYQSIQIQKGHIYLLAVDIDSNNTNLTFGIYKDSSGYKVTTAFTGKKMLVLANIDGDVDGHNIDLRIRVNDSSSTTYTATNFIVKDLTLYFNGTIPSDADTIAEIQQNYPHLLTPSEYGTRIVDSSYSGVRAWARNLFDKTQIKDTTYGTPTISGERISVTGTYYCSFNINLEAGQYYLKFTVVSYTGSRGVRLQYEDGTLVDTLTSSGLVTLTKKATTVLLYCGSGSSATSVYEDICINKSDSLDGTFTPWFAPNTLSLTFQGKSAGSVAEMYYPETGEQTHPLKRITLDGTESWSGTFSYGIWVELDDLVHESDYIGKILASGGFITVNNYNTVKNTDYTISGYYDNTGTYPTRNFLYIRITSTENTPALVKTWLQNHPITVTYELVTPAPSTFVTPIIDNTLLTESGGRMATVQTGTVVDGSFDMGFITL